MKARAQSITGNKLGREAESLLTAAWLSNRELSPYEEVVLNDFAVTPRGQPIEFENNYITLPQLFPIITNHLHKIP